MAPRALEDAVARGLAYAMEDRLAPHYERHIVEDCHYRTPDVVADALVGLPQSLGSVSRPRLRRSLGSVHRLWLDLGAGTGLVGKAVVRKGLAVELFAIDLSEAMLALIDCPTYVDRRCSDAGASLPFPDAAFDGVLAAGLLEHVTDPGAVFRNAARVMKPGGAFVFSFPPNRAGRTELYDADEGLVSHDPVAIRACLGSLGLEVRREWDFPAYLSGSKGWVVHHLVVGIRPDAS